MKAKQIIFIFLVAGTFTSCKYFKEHRLFSKDVDTLLDQSAELVVEPEIDTTEVYQVVEEIEPEMIEEEEPQLVATNQGSSRFHMIAGSFQNQNFAEKYANQLQQMGYQPEIIYASNGFYRVSAKSYQNYRDGIGDIEAMRAAVSPSAWLHVKN